MKKIRSPVVFLLAALAVLSLSLGAAGTADAARRKKGRSKPSVVIAEINDYKLTLEEIEERLNSLPPAVRIAARKNRDKFIKGLVQAELLFQEGLRKKLDRLPRVKRVVRRAMRRIVINELLKRVVRAKVKVSEEEVRKFFQKNKGKFRRKESVALSHIVVRTEGEAKEIVAQLRKGRSFAELARERSIVRETRESGGVMGTVEKGELNRKLEEVAFSLPIGQVSDPVPTPLGWQIIKVSERNTASTAKFEDVKDDARQILLELRRNDKYNEFVEKLQKKGKVKIHLDRFK